MGNGFQEEKETGGFLEINPPKGLGIYDVFHPLIILKRFRKMMSIYGTLAKPYAKEVLEALDGATFLTVSQISELLEEEEIIKMRVKELENLGLISKSPHTSAYHLTSRGKISLILSDMIEGGSLKEGIKILSPYTVKEFELLTENVTDTFLEMIYKRRIFQNIYLCSPWIQIKEQKRKLLQKVIRDSKKSLGEKMNILVIVRPPNLKTEFGKKINETLQWLERLGGDISLVKRLHTKLYIAEPGSSGGLFFAIFGSENLTGARNIELGIKIINNTSILNKLITYFFDIYNRGKPYENVHK